MRPFPYALLIAAGLATAQAAERTPSCARPIRVAASPIGYSMAIDDKNQVSGVVADFLSYVGKESSCRFSYTILPRVRAFPEMRQGTLDLIASSVRTPERDQAGQFVPAIRAPIVLITLAGKVPAADAARLLAQGKLTINVVRGHDYGPVYQQLLSTLRAQGKLEEVDSPLTVARKLAAGRADGTIMLGVVMADVGPEQGLANRLQIQPLHEIPPAISGFYLSGKTLSEPERGRLASALKTGIRQGELWRLYRKYYPAWALEGISAQGLED